MEPDAKNTLGENIKKLRRVRGMDQTEFAASIFSSVTTVSLWERGEKIPEDEDIQRIAGFQDL